MNKAEAIAYLRKKQLLEKLADREAPPSSSEAVEELEKMEKSDEKDLTTDPTNV